MAYPNKIEFIEFRIYISLFKIEWYQLRQIAQFLIILILI